MDRIFFYSGIFLSKQCTVGQNILIIYFPTSPGVSEWANERSGACKQNGQGGASECVGGVSKQANGRASGPVLTSRFLVVLDHSDSASQTMLVLSPARFQKEKSHRIQFQKFHFKFDLNLPRHSFTKLLLILIKVTKKASLIMCILAIFSATSPFLRPSFRQLFASSLPSSYSFLLHHSKGITISFSCSSFLSSMRQWFVISPAMRSYNPW